MIENKIKVCIAEDEYPARELLLKFINNNEHLHLVGYADNGMDAAEMLQKHEYDLAILDINLPHYSGVELSKFCKKNSYLIFATALKEHAISAYDLGAIDYLLKPYSEERFHTAIDRVIQFSRIKKNELNKTTDLGFTIYEKNNHYIIPYKEIIYLSSHGKKTVIHTITKDYEINKLLKEVEGKIPEQVFRRIHKQIVVNINFISHIQYNQGGSYIAYLKDEDETELAIGRSFASDLKEVLKI
ncbi:MAG: response regulator transcription factor [Leptospira sp.]|nr:response regulator transcription factor [Leptospira sp.]NCS93360.1 response regulator transcription factor [Leptospira sp.]